MSPACCALGHHSTKNQASRCRSSSHTQGIFQSHGRNDGTDSVERSLDDSDGISASTDTTIDLEKGPQNPTHVVLRTSSLACAKKQRVLNEVLNGITAVTASKIDYLDCRLDLDVNESLRSVSELIKDIEAQCNVSCEVARSNLQFLDVTLVDSAFLLEEHQWPLGVSHVVDIDKLSSRIYYDAGRIGARDVLLHFGSLPPASHTNTSGSIPRRRSDVRSLGLLMLVSVVLTIPVLVLCWAPMPPNPMAYGAVCLSLATILQIAVVGPLCKNAFCTLWRLHLIEVDFLVVMSTTAAYIFSVVSYVCLARGTPLSSENFFPTSTLLTTLVMLGRWISALASQKAIESAKMKDIQPDTATVVTAQGEEQTFGAYLLQYGDIFKVGPHERVVTDGVVVGGSSEVDESLVTGESKPIVKTIEGEVIAGCTNCEGTLYVRLTALPCENSVSVIANMVEDAKTTRPRVQEIADRVAGCFVPAILVITLVTFVAWLGVGMHQQGYSAGKSATQAITYAISVLVVSCPCAIALAVPMVIVIANGLAAKRGLVFKSAQAMEQASRVRQVVFDKTGTLTQGELCVLETNYFQTSQEETEGMLLGLLDESKHPVAMGVMRHLSQSVAAVRNLESVESEVGSGMQSIVDGCTLRAGNCRWTSMEEHPVVAKLLMENQTVFCATLDDVPIAAFGLADSIRPEAEEVISTLRHRKDLAISIVSGDEQGAVCRVAQQLQVPLSHVRWRCSPADKAAYVRELQSTTGNRTGMSKASSTVLFCGDGMNDAVALAQADIGVHVGRASHIGGSRGRGDSKGSHMTQAIGGGETGSGGPRDAADVAVLHSSQTLRSIPAILDLGTSVKWRVKLNFAWCAVYNLAAILLAAGAFSFVGTGNGKGPVRIPPQFAGLGELVSVLPVVGIAVALRYKKW